MKTSKLSMGLIICEFKSGKTTKQVAAQFGVTPACIQKHCRNHGFSLRDLKAYQAHKADILAFKQSQIIESMKPGDIKKASLRDRATTFGILNNAERLERGQSTANLNMASLNLELKQVEEEIAKLEAEII